jgi:RNA ligase (TIGR02306 family)
MRELASVRRIDNIYPIEGADRIEVAMIGGWTVVVKKGEFSTGDLCIYCEIDSFIPHLIAPFLTKDGQKPKIFNGIEGQRLRTVKLRGQLSQGLLLPLSILGCHVRQEGEGVSTELNIQKYEPPVDTSLAGEAKGNFPSEVPKTDQERVQNLTKALPTWHDAGLCFEVTEKLEGSSCTIYLSKDGVFEVCSRNLSLKPSDTNTFWMVARQYNLEQRMRDAQLYGYAIQGELVGGKVQGNIYKLTGNDLFVFDIYHTETMQYLSAEERTAMCAKLGLKHVPILFDALTLKTTDVQEILSWAEGSSHLLKGQEREGIVFKCLSDTTISFKAISNKYLLKQG